MHASRLANGLNSIHLHKMRVASTPAKIKQLITHDSIAKLATAKVQGMMPLSI
jgi:hypothetical protein